MPVPLIGRPADFAGAVGGPFTVTLTATPTALTAGEPIRATLRIAGPGAAHVPRPPWPMAGAFAVTPAGERSSERPPGREFDWRVVPLSADVRSLPRFKFVYFNPNVRPASRGFQTTYAEPVALAVSEPRPPTEVVPISEPCPLWPFLVPVTVIAAALLAWRHHRSPRMNAVRRLRQTTDPREVVRILGEYVAARSGPPVPTTPAEFAKRGAVGLAEFVRQCDAARFGPDAIGGDWSGEAVELVAGRGWFGVPSPGL